MSDVLPFLIVGLVSGSLYGLAGVGLVLTYRTSGVLNLAHGSIAAGAAFLFYTLHVEHQIPWPVAALSTIALFGVVVGFTLERFTRSFAGAAPVLVVVLTVGLILAIQGFLFIQYGDVTRNFPPFLPSGGFQLSGVTIGWDQVISATIALGSAAGLYVFLRSTRLGTVMRAVVDSPTLVGLTAQDPRRVATTAWMIGASFAALSGILIAPTIGLDATLLTLLVVQSFGACAIGAFKSLPLTYLGGLIVGVAASLATKYITVRPWTGLPPAIPFVVLIAVLVVVPKRLPTTRASTRTLASDGTRTRTRTSTALGAATVAALCLAPFIVGTYLPLWTGALAYFIVFASLGLLVWTSGQISLCQLSFVALGATSMSHLTDRGVPWFLALLLAGLVTVPVGALVAIPAIRTSGIYLALVTIGFSILMQNVVFQSDLMFGVATSVSVPRPHLGFVDATNDRWYYFVCLAIAGATIAVLAAVQRGQLGGLLRGMAEAPSVLTTNGLEVNRTKLIVFCISAFFAAIGGGLMVTQYGSVSGQGFGPFQSLVLVAVLAVCGTRLVRSSFLAALAIAVLPGYVSGFDANAQLVVFGGAAAIAALLLANRDSLRARVNHAAVGSAHRARRGPVTARFPQPTGVSTLVTPEVAR